MTEQTRTMRQLNIPPMTPAQKQFETGKYDESALGTRSLAAAAMHRAEEVAASVAALAAKVDELSNLQILDAKHFHDRLRKLEPALESPAAAPESDEMRVSRDLMIQLRDITDKIPGNLSQEIDKWLWISAPHTESQPSWIEASAPEPVCQNCGKPEPDHFQTVGCDYSPPPASPATAHQEPPDAVLVAISGLYLMIDHDITHPLMTYLREEWKSLTGDDERTVYEVDSAIRAYGRDGAR